MGRPILILRATAQQDDSALAQAAAALSSGQSASFTTQSSFGEPPLEWQTAFYHDATNGLIHLMGKRANDDEDWSHQIYDVATDTWGSLSAGMWSNVGHIYGNTAMDFTTGDLYQSTSANNGGSPTKKAKWWKKSTQTWTQTPADISASGIEDIGNGLAFHPNLYGAGDGGLCWETSGQTMFWRKSNDAVQAIGHTADIYGNKEGAGLYWPAQDIALIGGSQDGAAGAGELLSITPNGASPTLVSLGAPPIAVAGHSHDPIQRTTAFGSLHVHPGNPNKILIVQTNGTDVYESTDGEDWTQVADHPVTRKPRVVCSLRGGLGALWFIGCDEVGQFSTLWKP